MNDKIRGEFEAWVVTLGSSVMKCGTKDSPSDVYSYVETQAMWMAWQASRESLVIELPPVRPEPTSSGDALRSDGEAATWNIWVGDKLAKKECREAIEAAGLKVKP